MNVADVDLVRVRRSDWLAAGFVALFTFAVYLYTLAPSVTLEDSGEFITAAVNFGVPHPPGYPCWTICSYIFSHIFPFGNVAWRVNMVSAIFGALANGLLALIAAHSLRWFLAELTPGNRLVERWSFYAAVTAGLVLGFTDVMWSQAVITEVYTLNAFFLMSTLWCFYRWFRVPEQTGWLIGSVFLFGLGLTNHHTLLSILPAFILGVFLATEGKGQALLPNLGRLISRFFFSRQIIFPSFFIGFFVLCGTALAIFAWFSEDGDVRDISYRISIIIIGMAAILSFINTKEFSLKRFLTGLVLTAVVLTGFSRWMEGCFTLHSSNSYLIWGLAVATGGLLANSILSKKLILGMLVAGWFGLSLYGYMKFASSTNPPMNWGYARENAGFFHAINRGQYQDNLASIIKRVVGPYVGWTGGDPEEGADQTALTQKLFKAVEFYYLSLEDNFSLYLCFIPLFACLYLSRLSIEQKHWFLFLLISFLLLAFMLSLVNPPSSFDLASLSSGKVFFLQSQCLFALAIAYGLISIFVYCYEETPSLPVWACGASIFLSIIPFVNNFHDSNQRNHWFGWRYGVDMLRPLEKGAIVFGGTDPGRFIPTYTIFCESTQDPRWKRDPSFDRSDLYIITQNALADRFYMKYIRDHYDDRYRSRHFTSFERWLGRDHQYPKDSLDLPDDNDFDRAFVDYAQSTHQGFRPGEPVQVDGLQGVFAVNGLLAKDIFEKNKKDHAFYVEESFPINWMYPYLSPAGLIMKINPEPLDRLTPEMVRKDHEFWDRYTAELLSSADFADDEDAQRSFSKLRLSIGNLYLFRNMMADAEYAYRQALALGPTNSEVVVRLADIYLNERRFNEAHRLLDEALQRDPENGQYTQLLQQVKESESLTTDLENLRAAIAKDPNNVANYHNLLELLAKGQAFKELDSLLDLEVKIPSLPQDELIFDMNLLMNSGQMDSAVRLLENRLKVEPANPSLHYNLAAMYAVTQQKAKALSTLQKAIKLGGQQAVEAAQSDNRWDALRSDPLFQKLISSGKK